VPLPEAIDDRPLGFSHTLVVILLSVIAGIISGFIVESAFGGWGILKLRWGWVLFAAGICFCIWLAFRQISLGLGSRLNLGNVTRSTIPAWKHPAIWSFALCLASADFGRIPYLNWNLIVHAAKWGAFDFLGLYTIMVIAYWSLSPAKWEREA
jgi:hypothetical protein